QYENREDHSIGPLCPPARYNGWHPSITHSPYEPNKQPTYNCTSEIANPSEHGRGEGEESVLEAHIEPRRVVVNKGNGTGSASQETSEKESDTDCSVNVDSHEGSSFAILRSRAHGSTDAS